MSERKIKERYHGRYRRDALADRLRKLDENILADLDARRLRYERLYCKHF